MTQIPFIVYEAAQTRAERTQKRLMIVAVVSIGAAIIAVLTRFGK